eukprot:603203-Pleurochrysis_carterae.AAC.1
MRGLCAPISSAFASAFRLCSLHRGLAACGWLCNHFTLPKPKPKLRQMCLLAARMRCIASVWWSPAKRRFEATT